MGDSALKIISQVSEQNTAIINFFCVMGNDIRQIATVEMIPGTAYGDGVKCCEDIIKALTSVYRKRMKEVRGR